MTSQPAFSRTPSTPMTTSGDLLDEMAQTAVDALDLLGLNSTPLPDALTLDSQFGGDPLSIEPHAFFGDGDHPIHFGRVVRVRGSDRVQVLNIVCFPTLESGWPILGIEVLVFTKGVHLVVLDAYDVAGNPQHPHLKDVLQHHRLDLHSRHGSSPIPDWGSAVFSNDAILIKPDARQNAPVTDFADAFHDLLDAYLGDNLSNPLPHHLRTQAQQARRNYLYSHGHHEPAGPFLERISDAQWVEEFVFNYLYPTWLYDGDQRPSWA